MSLFANTPKPPYYAVIFSSTRTDDNNGYNEMASRMVELAQQQPGFLGVESARENIGITVYSKNINRQNNETRIKTPHN